MRSANARRPPPGLPFSGKRPGTAQRGVFCEKRLVTSPSCKAFRFLAGPQFANKRLENRACGPAGPWTEKINCWIARDSEHRRMKARLKRLFCPAGLFHPPRERQPFGGSPSSRQGKPHHPQDSRQGRVAAAHGHRNVIDAFLLHGVERGRGTHIPVSLSLRGRRTQAKMLAFLTEDGRRPDGRTRNSPGLPTKSCPRPGHPLR